MDDKYADLLLGIFKKYGNTYKTLVRFDQSGDATNDMDIVDEFSIDENTLAGLSLEDEQYGKYLARMLFANSKLRDAFSRARNVARELGIPLRLQLYIDPEAKEIHNLGWEKIADPQDNWDQIEKATDDAPYHPLTPNERLIFSRFLSGKSDSPKVKLRSKHELSALVVIADPIDIETFFEKPLPPLNMTDEYKRANGALGKLTSKLTVLARKDLPGRVGLPTLEKLKEQIRGDLDVIYLVCHGVQVDGEPVLALEKENGYTDAVWASRLVDALNDLPRSPTLVVLASCQSSGKGIDAANSDGGLLAALGPRLAAIGVPTVLAMQGNIMKETIESFMPTFFEELERDGRIDRAVAAARGRVYQEEKDDWWAPALFSRLKRGRIWYDGEGSDQDFDQLPGLLRAVRKGECTPILGTGISDHILGSREEIARDWAEQFHFPMAVHERESLPQVAQFLAINQSRPTAPQEQLEDHLRRRFLGAAPDASLSDLIMESGRIYRAEHPNNALSILASLPFKIYVTTLVSDLLLDALREAKREPERAFRRWKIMERYPWPTTIYDREPSWQPDVQHPLVYHLFGHIEQPRSVVLTEDEYFNYLLSIYESNEPLHPGPVGEALVQNTLIFLGFRLEDWDFRVMLRSLGRNVQIPNGDGGHVAVQVDPENDQIQNPRRARRYLKDYFKGRKIDIIESTADGFMRHLKSQWDK